VFAALSVLFSAGLIALLVLHPPTAPQSGTFRGDIYGIAVTAEFIAIILAVVALKWLHRKDLVYPVIGLIVGLHFIGMWKATDLKSFLALALGMSVISIVALFLPDMGRNGFSPRRTTVGLGCAAMLWAWVSITVL
jgi:hypothetical protein